MDAFDRYAPFVQDFIYRNDWRVLRGVQLAAADALFNSDDNLLLTSTTASGKTEAAFFPILTLLSEDPPSSVGALYVGPLKALINDQFARLTELCAEGGIPVWRWHGDVAASQKAKLVKHPSGILQITPESLEALLLHRHAAIPRLFGDLRFIVIDEVHSLMRADRGGQTLCVIERLSRLAGVNPRRVGLSATVGDPERMGELLSLGTGRTTVIPRIEDHGQRWRLSMEHFYVSGPQAASAGEHVRPAAPSPDADAQDVVAPMSLDVGDTGCEGDGRLYEAPSDAAPPLADPGVGYIFEHTRGRKCLVFANSREEAEALTSTLRSYCEAKGEDDRFLIHHGNLSAALRESAEDAMKDENRALTTVTTSTLELGIDIGRLERAFQIDAPFTVSSFLQRLGRTGRRGDPPEMWFVMREEQPEPRASIGETIPWKLLQGIALIQLYLEERWVEPPRLGRLPYSLLFHQTLAILASEGEMTPAQLATRVLTLSPFREVSADDFRVLLLHLIETEQIQRTDEGGLIVGLAGERVVNNYRFYGVFVESEEYTVRSDSQELGTTVMPPPVGDKIAIAGATWLVEEIDYKRHVVYCTQVKGRVPAYFGECPGDIHTHILERMAKVLAEDEVYPYLMDNAQARLAQARGVARTSGMLQAPLINIGGDSWALFPWLGSYAFLALERFLKLRCAAALNLRGLDSSRPYFLQFRMDGDAQKFVDVLREQAQRPLDPIELLYPGEVPIFNKYDEYVPPELIRKGFAYGVLDVKGMLRRVCQWCGLTEPSSLAGAPRFGLPQAGRGPQRGSCSSHRRA